MCVQQIAIYYQYQEGMIAAEKPVKFIYGGKIKLVNIENLTYSELMDQLSEKYNIKVKSIRNENTMQEISNINKLKQSIKKTPKSKYQLVLEPLDTDSQIDDAALNYPHSAVYYDSKNSHTSKQEQSTLTNTNKSGPIILACTKCKHIFSQQDLIMVVFIKDQKEVYCLECMKTKPYKLYLTIPFWSFCQNIKDLDNLRFLSVLTRQGCLESLQMTKGHLDEEQAQKGFDYIKNNSKVFEKSNKKYELTH